MSRFVISDLVLFTLRPNHRLGNNWLWQIGVTAPTRCCPQIADPTSRRLTCATHGRCTFLPRAILASARA